MVTSSVCQCQTWRRHRSWSSNWNPPTMALTSAEWAILREHQHAHLMSLVSVPLMEKKVVILLLSVLYSCTHAPLTPYKDLFFLLCHSVIFIKHCCSISLSVIQHNHTMLSFTLIHPTLSGFWKETTIPTICSGHKKIPMLQIAS